MENSIVSRQAWLQAREQLLLKEKAHTAQRDEISALRRALPWVRVDKPYLFTTPDGKASLSDLFEDKSQLIVYHFMYGEGWEKPCIGCSQWADAFTGTTEKYADADARLIAVSRAGIDVLMAEQARRQWRFPWVSDDSDFGIDFNAASDDPGEETRVVGAETVGFDRGENHGISVFYRGESGEIFHTYSCYNRGVEPMNGSFGYYDLLPRGRAW